MSTNTTSLATQLGQLLTRLLSELCAYPDLLSVDIEEEPRGLRVILSASGADTPRLIGAGGSHFKALSAIVSAVGRKHGLGAKLLSIGEPRDKSWKPHPEFAGRQAWDWEKVTGLAEDLALLVFSEAFVTYEDGADFRTTLFVHLPCAEQPELVEGMQQALGVMLKAVGKANGRRIEVRVVAD